MQVNFGDFIRIEREKLGFTQTELGAKIGINAGAISKIEHGRKSITSSKLQVIAELFQIELSRIKELYFGEKIANEIFLNNCPDTTLALAELKLKYLKSLNTTQSQINFNQ
ncbi:helix-turn-helix domain-containing protein [Pedobacter jeongneungensis]|uniref:helix-turn-helix domain-containing protein n=1 Tax=Pedobacter jeongneungensis TaxID=947309 RepID=UPI00046893AC|nr:helix-turn-helix transcriptional regulator [Pedobacter jeongneungensis]